jgi:cob(I)alamin adenosyltransferase
MIELSLKEADKLADAATAKAASIGVAVVVAVCDNGGNLIVQKRMDGAFIGSIDIAVNKAYTAVAFQMPTSEFNALIQPGTETYGIGITNLGKLAAFAGGFPIKKDGNLIGAIGVSGGSAAEDVQIATAALERL